MEEMSVGEILSDFRSIKLPPDKRRFIDETRESFQSRGDLPLSVKRQLWTMVRHYKRQFDELHASRARARRTNWRLREGLTIEQERDLVELRRRADAERKADLGI
ncbi:MAG: hypothetical protein JW704_09785 [Anaerolineaceae bacterium]|nr:hypothetical protein [Anaerolineaceae bacterium]